MKKPTKKPAKSTTKPTDDCDASRLIDGRIRDLGDWRGEMLARVRAIIRATDPAIVETWKWRGVPVWEQSGIVCTGETYKEVVKLTFAKGASLKDPSRLFNASLEGNARRAIDIREGDKVDAKALTALVREAIALNAAKKAPKKSPATAPARKKPTDRA